MKSKTIQALSNSDDLKCIYKRFINLLFNFDVGFLNSFYPRLLKINALVLNSSTFLPCRYTFFDTDLGQN